MSDADERPLVKLKDTKASTTDEDGNLEREWKHWAKVAKSDPTKRQNS
jgi:hypothetical protein